MASEILEAQMFKRNQKAQAWKCLREIKKRVLGNKSLEMFRRNQKEQAWKCLGEIKKRKLGNV